MKYKKGKEKNIPEEIKALEIEEEDIVKLHNIDKDTVNNEAIIEPGVNLDNKTLKVLQKDPKNRVFGRVTLMDQRIETEALVTKLRWNKVSKEKLEEEIKQNKDLGIKMTVEELKENETVETVSNSVSTVQEVLGDMMGDAPACPDCGHITIRNGSCYKCLNCGNSLGCS